MKKEEVRARIEEIGIIPAVRVTSEDDALFAAEAVFQGAIPIVEITMTVPGAIDVISHLVRELSNMVVGAGTVLDADTAHRCIQAGASFITSPGLDLSVVERAIKENVLVFPGALTPSEVMAAWKAGSDMVKVYPCGQVGGEHYIRALKSPFPQVPLIASGGVNQQTAGHFILAGAVAIGVGRELIPTEAIHRRQLDWVLELARRFTEMVKHARKQRTKH